MGRGLIKDYAIFKSFWIEICWFLNFPLLFCGISYKAFSRTRTELFSLLLSPRGSLYTFSCGKCNHKFRVSVEVMICMSSNLDWRYFRRCYEGFVSEIESLSFSIGVLLFIHFQVLKYHSIGRLSEWLWNWIRVHCIFIFHNVWNFPLCFDCHGMLWVASHFGHKFYPMESIVIALVSLFVGLLVFWSVLSWGSKSR